MVRSRTAMILMAGLLSLVGAVLPITGLKADVEKSTVPSQAQVSIELDQKEYFLGENVLLHFCIENVGADPFKIDLGGDYRFASRALRFSVRAIDAAGRPCDDPDPSGFCMGGIGYSPTIKPGKKHYESIPLLRYCRIEAPGVYTLRVSHDLGWRGTPSRPIPVAETTIRFLRPSEDQARKVVDAMARMPANHGLTSGQKNPPFRDFSVLRDPVYLPVLVERTPEKSEDALQGIGGVATPQATEALIRLAGNDDAPFALNAAQTLDMRLPDPQLTNELPGRSVFMDDHLDARRWLVKKSWRPRFAADVAALSHQFLARQDREGVECGGYMLQCVGTTADLPFLTRALDREIAAAAKAPLEKDIYPRPRGACQELLRAAQVLGAHGLKDQPEAMTAGQAVVYLCAVGVKAPSRPEGWERQYARLMRHEAAYVREVALDNLPLPVPESLLPLLPGLITDKDVDVQIAACRLAEKVKLPQLKGPVLQALAAAHDEWLQNAAANAASAMGAVGK